jgi:hypothetical protein
MVRAISRLRNDWVSRGLIASLDPDLLRYQSRLLIPIEHNFGMSVSKVINRTDHQDCWTNKCFHAKLRAGGDKGSLGCATFGGECDGYDGLDEFARERNSFLFPLRGSGDAPGIEVQQQATGATSTTGSDGPTQAYTAFAAEVNQTIAALTPVPSLAERLKGADLVPVDIHDPQSLLLQTPTLRLQFDQRTGAISSMLQTTTTTTATPGEGGVGSATADSNRPGSTTDQWEWAGGERRLGEFVYRTYTQEHDIDRFVSQFTPDYAGVYPHHLNKSNDYNGACWNKPGHDDSIRKDPAMAHLSLASISRAWNVSLVKAWKSKSKSSSNLIAGAAARGGAGDSDGHGGGGGGGVTMLLQLALPTDAVELFGGMQEILLNVTALHATSSPPDTRGRAGAGAVDVVEVSLSWKGKTPTRLAESSWLSFNPDTGPCRRNLEAAAAAAPGGGGWQLDVLGNPVDPSTVVFNGSRHFHAVHRGVCYEGAAAPSAVGAGAAFPRLTVQSLDTPFVAPGGTDKLIDFDNAMPDPEGGMHFNLHNNAGWDCSAPWWNGDDSFFRFRLKLQPQASQRGECWEV